MNWRTTNTSLENWPSSFHYKPYTCHLFATAAKIFIINFRNYQDSFWSFFLHKLSCCLCQLTLFCLNADVDLGGNFRGKVNLEQTRHQVEKYTEPTTFKFHFTHHLEFCMSTWCIFVMIIRYTKKNFPLKIIVKTSRKFGYSECCNTVSLNIKTKTSINFYFHISCLMFFDPISHQQLTPPFATVTQR